MGVGGEQQETDNTLDSDDDSEYEDSGSDSDSDSSSEDEDDPDDGNPVNERREYPLQTELPPQQSLLKQGTYLISLLKQGIYPPHNTT